MTMMQVEEDVEIELEGDDQESVEEEAVASARRIFTRASDPPIKDLYDRFKDGDLLIQPEFQRYFVWDRAKSSRLIESVLLDVPLPIIYLSEESDGRESVIDGQQRLTSFFDFIDGSFALTGLQERGDLNSRHFTQLDREAQAKIRRAALRTITIQKESDKELKFEIFERLNTGSVPLNPQELRNCVYRGPYNALLRNLATEPDFSFLLGLTKPERRMRDVELVLRFAAFHHAGYLKYKPPMKTFLNLDMERFQSIAQSDSDDLRQTFKKSCSLVRSLLASNAFRRYYAGDEKNPNGRWEPKKFNASLYDVLMYGFTLYEKNQVYPYLDSIREALICLMSENQPFVDSIELSTSAVKMVTVRFDTWRLTLSSIMGYPTSEPRCFSLAIKEGLYLSNRYCSLCRQKINDIDDAAVDHINQYWMGGKTIPENARLTHRYCNMARPRIE